MAKMHILAYRSGQSFESLIPNAQRCERMPYILYSVILSMRSLQRVSEYMQTL